MLKQGVVFVGAPTYHLHELVCLALHLGAPLVLTDNKAYEICLKFSHLTPVHLITPSFSFNLFTAGLNRCFTNLAPEEVARFLGVQMHPSPVQIFHLFEVGPSYYNTPPGSHFCSSLPHTESLIPKNSTWTSLGPIGYLSYLKYKKELLKIAIPFLPKASSARLKIAQIVDINTPLTSLDTQDLIDFINLSFIEDTHIPAHGLLDTFIEYCEASLLQDAQLVCSALFHKKPFFIKQPLERFYESLNPLVSILPKDGKNLVPLIENYFDFQTLNRDDFVIKQRPKFFPKNEISSTPSLHL